MNRKLNKLVQRSILAATVGFAGQAFGTVVVEYDAAGGLTPDALPNPWTRFGAPMFNVGGYLLQDNTFDDPDTESGEYRSPAFPGTMHLTSGQYGIETKVRPLTDVPFLGNSHYANCYVFWSDDSFAYNITIDKDTDDNGPGTTGGIKYGQNSMSNAVTGVDWSVTHNIYVGYRSSAPFGVFDFYVDGALKNTVSAGSMARSGGFPFAQDAVDFGDGTTGQGIDIAAEWYTMKIHDTAIPIVPAAVWNVDADGNWGTASNWTGGVPDSLTGSATATFGSVITASRTVTLDAAHLIGHVIFDNSQSYTIAGSNTLQFSTPGNASIDVLQGSHTISTPVSMTSHTVITVAAGANLNLSGSSVTTGINATVTKTGPGTLQLAHIRGHRMNVDQGTAKIIAGAGANTDAHASKLIELLIAGGLTPTAQLDITNNTVLIDYTGASPITTIQAQINAGFANGAWNGNGIISSNAAIPSASKTAVGFGEASAVFGAGPYPNVSGQTVDADTLLIRYVYSGDANLDGKVDSLDFNALAANFGAAGATLWTQGNFSYDGVVDSLDFNALASNFGLSLPGSVLGSVVPEPTSLVSLGAGAMLFASRRRRGSCHC